MSNKIKVTYKRVKELSEEDRRKIDGAFDVLFNVIYEKYWVKRKK